MNNHNNSYFYCRLSCAFCYYALSYGVGQLAGNIFLNNFIMCIVEGLAYVACYVISWWGRKWPAVGSYMLAGVSLLLSLLVKLYIPGECSLRLCVLLIWHLVIYACNLRQVRRKT